MSNLWNNFIFTEFLSICLRIFYGVLVNYTEGGYQYTNPYTKPWFFIWFLISILHQPLIIHLTVHQASTMPLNLSKLFKFLSQSILILKVWGVYSFFIVLQKFREIKEYFETSVFLFCKNFVKSKNALKLQFFILQKFREIKYSKFKLTHFSQISWK